MRPVRSGLTLLVGGLAGVALAACAPPKATVHCAPVIAQRPEATVTYPGSAVLERDAHEGAEDFFVAPGLPWAAQSLGAATTQKQLFDWYSKWLSSHGWSHQTDQTVTESDGTVSGVDSKWTRGDEMFDVGTDLLPRARARLGVAADQLLFTTDYLAPGSVLGCS